LFVNPVPVDEFESLKRKVTRRHFLMYGQDFLLHRPKPSNTGIMFMHLEGFDQAWEERIKPWGQRLLDEHCLDDPANNQTQLIRSLDGCFPPHDQLWLNRYYDRPKKWSVENVLLPPTWNWKVYWELEAQETSQQNIRIVHFHGPKPYDGVNEAAVCNLDSINHTNLTGLLTFPSAYHQFVSASLCCDHGRTSHRVLQMYHQWKPSRDDVAKW
jgi:hypothetical protein